MDGLFDYSTSQNLKDPVILCNGADESSKESFTHFMVLSTEQWRVFRECYDNKQTDEDCFVSDLTYNGRKWIISVRTRTRVVRAAAPQKRVIRQRDASIGRIISVPIGNDLAYLSASEWRDWNRKKKSMSFDDWLRTNQFVLAVVRPMQ